MFWFSIASLTPPVLIGLASLWGGVWSWAALGSMSALVLVLDRIGRRAQNQTGARGAEALQVALALAHFALLLPVATSLPRIGWNGAIPLVLAQGLFMGQISHPNAHELIHRPTRALRRLGVLVYATMLIGHHASAHLKVHHVHVATPQDPNTARRGEGFYRFLPRAWIGSFRAGLAAENAARQRKQIPPSPLSHPYVAYIGIALLCCAAAYLAGGIIALILFLFATAHAQMQIFLADYVQHYGLLRQTRDTGRPVPVGPQHSWNAPHWYSSAMMLNAPRHSDHHVVPARRFPELRLTPDMPTLPHSLPVMGAIALIPSLWRRKMGRELAKLSGKRSEGLD